MPELILASGSPRRQDYIRGLGLDFVVDTPNVDETPLKGENPRDYVQRVARDKAKAVAQRHQGKVVLAADTTVTVGRRILGKPIDREDAIRMLELMSGKRQHVLTTVVIVTCDGSLIEKTTDTAVKFRPLNTKDIILHLSDEDNWKDAAGGYKLQSSSGTAMVKSINGSFSGVVGLPMAETVNLLRRADIDL